MSIGHALLVSADADAIKQFSTALQQFSISPDLCSDARKAVNLLNRKKFEAVVVDLKLGDQSAAVFDVLRFSSSNRTAVTFAIGDQPACSTAACKEKATFLIRRPLSTRSILSTLKPAYGLILRERRRYFRCPISIPVTVGKPTMWKLQCFSVNISEGGMALKTSIPLNVGEQLQICFTLPEHNAISLDATVRWCKAGCLGLRFTAVRPDRIAELQSWLAEKLEELLPSFVATELEKPSESFHASLHTETLV
jgi:ActR/RegA family two-component response regulator